MTDKPCYEKALASGYKIGWSNAGEHSMRASTSRILGGLNCLNPKNIYDWANRHNVDLLHDVTKTDQESLGAFFVAVINNVPLEEARLDS